MIETIDGVIPDPEDLVYVIGFDEDNEEFRPWYVKASEVEYAEATHIFYSDIQLCQQQCDLMNKDKI